MLKLQAKDIYLTTLERADCKRIWQDYEYDFDHPSELLNLGHSAEKADVWFDEMQRDQGSKMVRLGIFLNDGTPIGDVALQDIDKGNRSCTLGMGITKLAYRGRGYGKQAVGLLLDYGFNQMGLDRISASTLEHNIAGQKSLEKLGFVLEGRERQAVYLFGRRYDRLKYGMLKGDYQTIFPADGQPVK